MRNTINNADRDEIRGTIMKHAFAERFFALALDRQELALRVYDEVVDADRVAEVGAPWVTTAKTRFQIAGDGQVLEFDVSGAVTIRPTALRSLRGWHFDTPDAVRRITLPSGSGVPPFLVTNIAAYRGRHQVLQDKLEALAGEYGRRSAEVSAILGRHTSVKKLLADWPEVEPFLPKGQAPVQVPAKTDLNAALGLPVGL